MTRIALKRGTEIRVLNLYRGQEFGFTGGAGDCRLVCSRPDARRWHVPEWTRVIRNSE